MKTHVPSPARAPGRPRPRRPWLVLVHQLPARASNVRVKTWRRLQQVGALAIKHAVYLLPDTPQAREDFEWIKSEIGAMKGEASVFTADTLDSPTGTGIVAAFQEARRKSFASLAREIETLLRRPPAARRPAGARRRALQRQVAALRERLRQIDAVDFFRASGRDEVARGLDLLEHRLTAPSARTTRAAAPRLRAENVRGRVWITRPRPGVDRMASAWLIRRFIDPHARFVFGDRPSRRQAIPFDMFGVEFSHAGGACTFETMARAFRIKGAAVDWIGRLVHQLDLRDERHDVTEAAAVDRLIEGFRTLHRDDRTLIERGIELFEALFRSYGAAPARARSR